MALDRDGNLHIFEIKTWEARSENLLQVLRYGQIFGSLDYEGLNQIWRRTERDVQSLAAAHKAKFEVSLSPESFNRKQVFIVLTNGLDVDTRQAIQYWRLKVGIEVRPWVYRAYRLDSHELLEIAPFRVADDPLEDQAESQADGFYILNTNHANNEQDDYSMLAEKKAAAYLAPWKFKIARLKRGDHVFLYRSREGIVAFGKADGKLKKLPYKGHIDEEYNMGLSEFKHLNQPFTASEIKNTTRNPNLTFRQTMISLSPEHGKKLLNAVHTRALNFPT